MLNGTEIVSSSSVTRDYAAVVLAKLLIIVIARSMSAVVFSLLLSNHRCIPVRKLSKSAAFSTPIPTTMFMACGISLDSMATIVFLILSNSVYLVFASTKATSTCVAVLA